MSAEQQRSPINFSSSFEKNVANFQDLSDSKKRDLELQERLEAERSKRSREFASEN